MYRKTFQAWLAPSKNGDICWLLLIRNECRSYLVLGWEQFGTGWVIRNKLYDIMTGIRMDVWSAQLAIGSLCGACVYIFPPHPSWWMLLEEHIIVQKLFLFIQGSFRSHLANWNADNPGVTPLPALTIDFREKGNARHSGRRRIETHTKTSSVH